MKDSKSAIRRPTKAKPRVETKCRLVVSAFELFCLENYVKICSNLIEGANIQTFQFLSVELISTDTNVYFTILIEN